LGVPLPPSPPPPGRPMSRPPRPPAPVLALLLLAAACGGEDGPGPPSNLLLVTLDTTRADHLGPYGYAPAHTPTLDRLARRGVVFERAYAPMSQTLPSHATLFTGLEPRQHRLVENHYLLGPEVETLAEIARDAGYQTAAFVGSYVVKANTGMGQGFSTFGEPRPRLVDGELVKRVERDADAVSDEAIAWLPERDPSRPFLLWLHYMDPHLPHEPPREWREKVPLIEILRALKDRREFTDHELDLQTIAAVRQAYDGEIAFMDHHLGRVLAALEARGMLDDTAVVVVGDHGEGLLEHGERGHGVNVFEELVHVPLIAIGPDGEAAGQRVARPVMMSELLPMMLDMMSLPDRAPGDSVWARLVRDEPLRARPVFFERPHYSPENAARRQLEDPGRLLGVIVGDHKYLRHEDGREWLFDLAEDPEELVDVSARQPERLARMRELLETWEQAFPLDRVDARAAVDPERARALEQLGY